MTKEMHFESQIFEVKCDLKLTRRHLNRRHICFNNMKDGKAIERTQLSLSIGPTVQWNSL